MSYGAYCLESEYEPLAAMDASIMDDDRLLKNLSVSEMHYLISGSYFKCLQTELRPEMRNQVADWLLEVSSEHDTTRHNPHTHAHPSEIASTVLPIVSNSIQFQSSLVCLHPTICPNL